MRTTSTIRGLLIQGRWIALSLLLLPSLAAAQVYVPGPPGRTFEIGGRVWFHWHRRVPPPVVYYAPPPPPAVYYAPPPPPAVVYQPAPAYYAPPPPPPAYPYPVYPNYAPPMTTTTIIQTAPVKPQWTSRLGIGATYEGLLSVDNGDTRGMGFLGQIRYRAARHLSLEVMSGYETSRDQNGISRTDVPVTFGLLVPFLGPEHMLSPYFVVAGGINFADLKLVDAPGFKVDDTRAQAIGQIGGGLELRLGRHFAINGDVRLEGRWNMNGPSEQTRNATIKVQGNPETPIADSVGLRLGVGATVYF